jgi:Ser/Thr protein kinase RdoA (MazF antagonist)
MEVERVLDTLADLHATFWQAPVLADPALGLCDCPAMLDVFSPVTAQRLPSETCPLPAMILEGWSLLQAMTPPDVADALRQLMADPQPLCTALSRYPSTLVHSDCRDVNLGLVWTPTPQTILLDWQLACHSAATVDVAWYIFEPQVQLSPISTKAAIDYYRQRLAQHLGAAFDERWWQPLWDLGTLVHVLRMGCFRAWFSVYSEDQAFLAAERSALEAHYEHVRAGLTWL